MHHFIQFIYIKESLQLSISVDAPVYSSAIYTIDNSVHEIAVSVISERKK